MSTDPRSAAQAPPRRPTPREPKSWEELGLDSIVGEHLVFKFLLGRPAETARTISSDICIANHLIAELMETLKTQKLLQHRGSTATGDFIYELTENGRAKALESRKINSYVGPAPVRYDHYLMSVRAQALSHRIPGKEDLQRAFGDLQVPPDIYERLGPAVTSGRALFLFGEPGNGKTSLAERMTKCFGDTIWIPNTLYIDGHFVKLYDPAIHEQVDFEAPPGTRVDNRWIHIKRPTVIAGGELTLDMLDIQANYETNIAEPPLQLKSNCGTLVIDDFGRGKTHPKEILNRWIFPLEKRIDFLKLPDGRKISCPFECMLVFSTNLQPRDLADEAFLRRIPYKIHVHDPSEAEFRTLIETTAQKFKLQLQPGVVDYLMKRHYHETNRPMRFCHPRDLLLQVVHLCAFERRAPVVGSSDFDRVVANYFGA